VEGEGQGEGVGYWSAHALTIDEHEVTYIRTGISFLLVVPLFKFKTNQTYSS